MMMGDIDRLFSPGVLDVTHRLLFSHHGATPVKLMDQKNKKANHEPASSAWCWSTAKYYFLTYNYSEYIVGLRMLFKILDAHCGSKQLSHFFW